MGCFDCLALTPFASLIATIILAVGVGLFCGCGLYALDETCKMFKAADLYLCDCLESGGTDYQYQSNFESLREILFWTIIGVTAFMGIWAIILLVLSFLSTYKSKTQVYGGESVSCGGFVCNAFFIFLNYVLTLGWLLAAALALIPIMSIVMFLASVYCPPSGSSDVPLDLQLYGYPIDSRVLESNVTSPTTCEENYVVPIGTKLDDFCTDAKHLQLWWGLFFGACCLVVIGLVHFLMCMSANYAYVKAGLKKSDYEEKKYQEEQELNDLSAYRSSDRIAPYGPY